MSISPSVDGEIADLQYDFEKHVVIKEEEPQQVETTPEKATIIPEEEPFTSKQSEFSPREVYNVDIKVKKLNPKLVRLAYFYSPIYATHYGTKFPKQTVLVGCENSIKAAEVSREELIRPNFTKKRFHEGQKFDIDKKPDQSMQRQNFSHRNYRFKTEPPEYMSRSREYTERMDSSPGGQAEEFWRKEEELQRKRKEKVMETAEFNDQRDTPPPNSKTSTIEQSRYSSIDVGTYCAKIEASVKQLKNRMKSPFDFRGYSQRKPWEITKVKHKEYIFLPDVYPELAKKKKKKKKKEADLSGDRSPVFFSESTEKSANTSNGKWSPWGENKHSSAGPGRNELNTSGNYWSPSPVRYRQGYDTRFTEPNETPSKDRSRSITPKSKINESQMNSQTPETFTSREQRISSSKIRAQRKLTPLTQREIVRHPTAPRQRLKIT